MKKNVLNLFSVCTVIFALSCSSGETPEINTLTSKEKKEGWTLLFDGKTLDGWRRIYTQAAPDFGWKVEDGCIVIEASGRGESAHAGDLATVKEYRDFDLSWEFKLSENANTGLKYYVDESLAGANSVTSGYAYGLEYQLIDDVNHTGGPIGGKVGGLYELIDASPSKEVRQPGEWNQARIIAKDNYIEHWLNGKKVLEYIRGSHEFSNLVARSKFKNLERYGLAPAGYIILQDHGDKAWFRNLKIREL